MKKFFPLMFVASCMVFVSTDAQAHDTVFGDWTMSVNPGISQYQSSVVTKAEAPVARTVNEKVYREVREVVTREHTNRPGFGYRPYYYGGGSNFSYYFPWRNFNYRTRGFSSYYRPRTIYNYGW